MRAKMEQKAFMLPHEIGKKEICDISGIQISKLNRIILAGEFYNFPISTKRVNRETVFDRDQIVEYMRTNNLKKMRVRPLMGRKEPLKNDFNTMARAFIRGLDSVKLQQERHE